MVAFHFRAIVCFAFEPNTGSSTGNGVAFGGGDGKASASLAEELQRERCGWVDRGRCQWRVD